MTIRNSDSASWPVRAAVAAVLASTLMVPSWAFAAEAEAEDAEELEEVQVTGTRIQVPGNYTSPNPMTSISAEEMRALGMVNVADALTMLVPQNVSTYMPTMIGDDQGGNGGGMETLDRGSFFIGNTIANLRGMDPTFGSRTLTMVDGRRVVSTSNQADVVDMNIIPSNLLQRMDIVTGGASATYGSGAMAGVVNLVLNNRLTGFNLDMDYGVNEAGDGGSPHISASGGLPLFGGRGHALIGVEWQDQSAIRDCAAARSWCAESRGLLTNSSGSLANPRGVLAPLPGYENFPARFEMANLRYSQFSENGAIHNNNSLLTTGYRFTDDGTDIEEYAYGFRGGTGANAMNGDGPLVTSGTAMRPSSERKTMFTNFEYNISERTTAYFQGNYAKTEGLNKNRYNTTTHCVRFNSQGTAAVVGGAAAPGDVVIYGGGGVGASLPDAGGIPYISPTRSPVHSLAGFRSLLGGLPAAGYNANGNNPWWVRVTPANASTGPTTADSPLVNFGGLATGSWVKIQLNSTGVQFWLLETITMGPSAEFNDPGTPAVLPSAQGRNAYAFLNTLTPEALYQVQRAFGSAGGTYGALQNPTTGALLSGFSSTAGGGTALETLYGQFACGGFSALRKVWGDQAEQWTEQESETIRTTAGIKGRFGRDWRWDAYYQYGQTESESRQNNVATNLRLAMAVDAIIDDRQFIDGVANPTYQQPICRILRDGPPVLDFEGRPLSAPDELYALAEGCVPINLFGSVYSDPAAAQMQRDAVAFAFVDSSSSGANSLHQLSFSANGTLWQGLGAGPMTGAFGLDVREDSVDNGGTRGGATFYERADLSRTWSDAYGGKTRVTEGFTELNLPLVSGKPGINLWSVNAGLRYASYYNKGGAGTTGASATQGTMNWKFSTVFEPFDWVRLRLTRSRDLRAAGYRELFLNQPGLPDQITGANPWRERSSGSDENQRERFGQIRVGNDDLKPEQSNTLTLGLVLSPGGWAQGMRMSVDYYNIKVKDGITTPFNAERPYTSCWEDSGNIPTLFLEDGEIDPNQPGINGLFDESLDSCREIQFGVNEDGSRNLGDIVSFNASRPTNGLPIQRRGLDLSWNYLFPLSRVVETLPGSLSLTIRAQHALEASGIRHEVNSNGYYVAPGSQTRTVNPDACGAALDAADPRNNSPATVNEVFYPNGFYGNRYTCVDAVGQIRTSVFIPGVTASPKWTGNIITSYRLGDLSASLSARYIGGAKLDNTWSDDPNSPIYVNAAGQILNGSVDNNAVKPYFNFSLNGSYDLNVGDLKQFQVFGSINNLFDKSPPFTGGGISGASAQYHDTMGRAYRMGVRLKF